MKLEERLRVSAMHTAAIAAAALVLWASELGFRASVWPVLFAALISMAICLLFWAQGGGRLSRARSRGGSTSRASRSISQISRNRSAVTESSSPSGSASSQSWWYQPDYVSLSTEMMIPMIAAAATNSR